MNVVELQALKHLTRVAIEALAAIHAILEPDEPAPEEEPTPAPPKTAYFGADDEQEAEAAD